MGLSLLPYLFSSCSSLYTTLLVLCHLEQQVYNNSHLEQQVYFRTYASGAFRALYRLRGNILYNTVYTDDAGSGKQEIYSETGVFQKKRIAKLRQSFIVSLVVWICVVHRSSEQV